MTTVRKWTSTDDNNLRSMIMAGHNAQQIATMLGRSASSVYARSHNLHLSFKRVKRRPYLGPEGNTAVPTESS